jgi:hypothetical protein
MPRARLPTSPRTGGNVLIPGSHKKFQSIPEVYPERLGRVPLSVDHFRFPSDDPMLAGTPPVMCHMEAGDLLLWDSRTIVAAHAEALAGPAARHGEGGNAAAPRRGSAQQIGLVAVTEQHVGLHALLLERCRRLRAPPKFVFTSSLAVFGGPAGNCRPRCRRLRCRNCATSSSAATTPG